jgi:hypothetical protein
MPRAVILAITLAAAPAQAAPLFEAQPEVAPANARLVLRDMLWNCGSAGCAAAQGTSRPAVVCAVLAGEVGPLRSFSFKGAALSAEALGKCNMRAKTPLADQIRTAARP